MQVIYTPYEVARMNALESVALLVIVVSLYLCTFFTVPDISKLSRQVRRSLMLASRWAAGPACHGQRSAKLYGHSCSPTLSSYNAYLAWPQLPLVGMKHGKSEPG